MTPKTRPIHVILGPTASGKSDAALKLAQQKNGVIICADAIQFYQGLPLLTAQPSQDDLLQSPHWLYETLPAHAPTFSAAHFCDAANKAIKRAHQDGLTPFLVGGTGFYIKALIEGLSSMPPVPADTLDSLSKQSTKTLYQKLKTLDSKSTETLDANDRQRVIRALSVLTTTGKPLRYWHNTTHKKESTLSFHITVIQPPNETLNARIEKRCTLMFEKGLMKEVRAFREQFLQQIKRPATHITKSDKHAKQLTQRAVRHLLEEHFGYSAFWPAVTRALGFFDLLLALEGGISEKAAKHLVIQRTRQYAKRQRTWIRHQVNAHALFDNAKNVKISDAFFARR